MQNNDEIRALPFEHWRNAGQPSVSLSFGKRPVCRRVCWMVLLFFSTVCASHAQQTDPAKPTVSSVLSGMQSAKWKDREKAFAGAAELLGGGEMSPNEADQLRLGIIQLLLKEDNGGLKQPDDEPQQNYGEGYGEDKAEYYAGLIGFVGGLNDERAIPALLGAASSGGMAIRAVAGFGRKALNLTLAQARSTDSDLASGALHVIREMLATHAVTDTESTLRIGNALKSALISPERRVRENAIGTIEYFPNREEFVPILQQIAEHDPYKVQIKQGNGSGKDVYLIRTRAQRLLNNIANHEPPPKR